MSHLLLHLNLKNPYWAPLLRAGEINHLAKVNSFTGIQTSAGELELVSLIKQKNELVSELRNQKYVDLIDEYGFDLIEVFDGTQPIFTHVPPTVPRSIMATFAPYSIALIAAEKAAPPEPIIRRS
jgi:hypothetical protein